MMWKHAPGEVAGFTYDHGFKKEKGGTFFATPEMTTRRTNS